MGFLKVQNPNRVTAWARGGCDGLGQGGALRHGSRILGAGGGYRGLGYRVVRVYNSNIDIEWWPGILVAGGGSGWVRHARRHTVCAGRGGRAAQAELRLMVVQGGGAAQAELRHMVCAGRGGSPGRAQASISAHSRPLCTAGSGMPP